VAGAYLRGTGLACALGLEAESCVSALLQGRVKPSRVRLEKLSEPAELAYYRIPDGAELFDPQRFERLLPAVLRAAVDEAGLTEAERRVLPLFIGSSCFSIGFSERAYAAALAAGTGAALPMPEVGYDYLAGLTRRILGSNGPHWTWNTACTSSANALLGALRALQLGWCRHALVLGAELANLTTLAGFTGLQLLADAVRPFDARRSGMVLGEGLAVVVLSLEPGSAGGMKLLGGANNCDSHSVTVTHPDGQTVSAVLTQALATAGVPPGEVRGLRAHGTSSPGGDTAEAMGLKRVFDPLPPVTVLKPYLGHTLGACGVNELVLFAGALKRGQLPVTPGFEQRDAALALEPITRPAPAPAGVYLLNHFGFGGNNTVLALEKAP